MILSISYQAKIFIFTVILGLIIGFIYDFIRFIRRIIVHSLLAIQLEDLVYWILMAVFAFMAILRANYGDIRPFLILGLFIGIVLYFLVFSKYILKIYISIMNYFKYILLFFIKVLRYFLSPFIQVLKFIFIPLRIFIGKLKKFNKKSKKHLKNIKKCAKIYIVFLFRCIRIIFKKY